MASVVLKMSVSLDGYVAPTDGSSDWVVAGRSEDGSKWIVETWATLARTSSAPPRTRAGWRTGPAPPGRLPD